MPAAARTRPRPSEGRQPSSRRRAKGDGAPASVRQSLEQGILLTATLCLLAFGAVMVYSASSATTVVQGHGYGSGYLVKFLVYGALGLIVWRLLARDGIDLVQILTAPLLA